MKIIIPSSVANTAPSLVHIHGEGKVNYTKVTELVSPI